MDQETAIQNQESETDLLARTRGSSRIVLFDGVCNLCNRWVRFLLRHDAKKVFVFASLQSSVARELLQSVAIRTDLDSIVLLESEKSYVRSSAVLRILKQLPYPWRLAAIFMIVPAPFRDAVYRFVAKRRYGWFGRSDVCEIPSPLDADRFLDA